MNYVSIDGNLEVSSIENRKIMGKCIYIEASSDKKIFF